MPVVNADWLKAGCHVNSTGPKWGGATELDPAIAARARLVVSDSPEQARALPAPWFASEPMDHLGGVLSGAVTGRQHADDITLYCSTGLAGTEALFAASLLTRST
jgi:alanine dehydrogenase